MTPDEIPEAIYAQIPPELWRRIRYYVAAYNLLSALKFPVVGLVDDYGEERLKQWQAVLGDHEWYISPDGGSTGVWFRREYEFLR